MSIHIDFDNFAEGSRRALGAAAADIDERGYATRGEVGRICGENYQWARHRLDQLRDAKILSQSATMLDDGSTVEKRYTLEGDHRETAETVREALAITGGDLDDEPGADAFYDVVDEIRELKERVDEEKGVREAAGDAVDGDLEERVAVLEDGQKDIEGDLKVLGNTVEKLRSALVLITERNDLDVVSTAATNITAVKGWVHQFVDHEKVRDDDY